MKKRWYSVGISDVESTLRTNAAYGLSRKAARSRMRQNGPNNVFFVNRKSAFKCFLTVCADPMLMLLIGVIAVAAIFGELTLAIPCGILVLLHVMVAFALYRRARRVQESLSSYSHPKCRVIRDGELFLSDSRAIVQGDVVLLGRGDVVPCDIRLVSSNQMSVEVFAGRNVNKNPILVKPSHDIVYHEKDTNAEFYEYKNMLYAGSVVLSGECRGIAVETGEDTYIGKLDGGIPLNNGSECAEILFQMRRFSKLYSFAVLLMIIPLTVIGIFSYGFDEVLNTFMLTLALAVSSLGDLLYVIGSIINTVSIERCTKKGRESAAVKSPSKLSTLARTDVLVLVGESAVCDREKKVFSVVSSGKLLKGKAVVNKSVVKAAEYMQIIHQTLASYPTLELNEGIRIPAEFKRYADCLGTNTEGFFMNSRISSPIINDRNIILPVRNGGLVFDLMLVSGIGVAELVQSETISSEEVIISAQRRMELRGTLQSMVSDGCEILSVCRRVCGKCVLEACFAFKRSISRKITDTVSLLAKAGIKTVIFLRDQTDISKHIVIESGIAKSESQIALLKRDRGTAIEEDKYSAYLGFSNEDILNYVCRQKAKGASVTLYTIASEYGEPFGEADVAVTADSTIYRSSNVDIEKLESWTPIGTEESRDGAQILKIQADALIHRADFKSGGVASIFNLIKFARNVILNIKTTVAYLISMHTMRLFATIPAIIVGKNITTPFLILFCGLVMDVLAVSVFAYNENSHIMQGQFNSFDFKHPLKLYKKNVIIASTAGLALSLTAIIISFVTSKSISGTVFISLVIMQMQVIIFSCDRSSEKNVSLKISVAATVALLIILTMLSLISKCAQIIGLVFSYASLVCIPVLPAVYLIFYFSFKKKRIK